LSSGEKGRISWPINALRNGFLSPLPKESNFASVDFADQPSAAEADQRCIGMSAPIHINVTESGSFTKGENVLVDVFCFASRTGVLETFGMPGKVWTTLRNHSTAHGRSIPGDEEISRTGRTVCSAHLDIGEIDTQIAEATFTPPADATPNPIKIVQMKGGMAGPTQPLPSSGKTEISPAVAAGLVVMKVAPQYPIVARSAQVQGVVTLQGTVGTEEGHLKDLHVVSGPVLLQQAALEAVSQWVYRPYLLSGKPVEVLATVSVVFALAEPAKTTIPNP
jgi:hypothetical protein